MTTEAAPSGDNPRLLLASTRELARRVRLTQRTTWFPLLLLAAVTFISIPVYRYGGHRPPTCVVRDAAPAARICSVYSNAVFEYWPIALVLAYLAIAAVYIHRTRAKGIETRVRPYAIAGIIIAVVMTGAAFWGAHGLLAIGVSTGLTGLPARLATPASAIGLALLVLAWAERNRALLELTIVYLVVVLVPGAFTFGWVFGPLSPWAHVPQLVAHGQHGA